MSGKLKNNKANYFEEVDEVFPKRVKDTDYNNRKPEIDPRKIIADQLRKDIKVIAKNDSQKNLINSIKNNEITICKGKPGSGKTYLAVAYALSFLQKKDSPFTKIYLIKSVQPLKNEELGFLKGSLKEKIDPYMWSYYINIEKIITKQSLDILIENNVIEPFPLAYMRGATLDNCLIIADECQNITQTNLKTLMTRIGSDSKMILLGDVNQIDMKNVEDSGFEHIFKMFEDIQNIGIIEMNPNDTSVRNPMIDIIESKFNEFENKKLNKKHKLIIENDENRN